MITDTHPSAPVTVLLCPFHNGVTTLDLLLAELDPREQELFDAVLDLRFLAGDAHDAMACVEQLFRVRALLGERYYLAFFRVRCWARQALEIQVRASRHHVWQSQALPLDC